MVKSDRPLAWIHALRQLVKSPRSASVLFPMQIIPPALFPRLFLFGAVGLSGEASAASTPSGDADHGKILFQQSCAVCHAIGPGPRNESLPVRDPVSWVSSAVARRLRQTSLTRKL